MFPFSFVGGAGEASTIVNAFKERVEESGGTFQAYSCMITQINELLSININ
jgi:hypothetical protein